MSKEDNVSTSNFDNASEDKKPRWRMTPRGLVLTGIVLAIVCFATDMAATIGLRHMVLPNPDVANAVTFGVYIVPLVLAFVAMIALFVGAWRWAAYGAGVHGVPERIDAKALSQKLDSIAQGLMLSETAKRIAYRAEDIQTLRQTIKKDMDRRNFNAALILVNEMSQNFGYREEAEAFRDSIRNARNAEIEAKVGEAIARLEDLLARQDFDKALNEADKLKRLYVDSPLAQRQPERVAQVRNQYVKDLERKFLQASQAGSVDSAMDLLKELDKYLTGTEAEQYRETARGVIGKKRDNLGVQFKLSVQDKDWNAALKAGEQLIQEFPNTRMADEARNMLDLIRQRTGNGQSRAALPS